MKNIVGGAMRFILGLMWVLVVAVVASAYFDVSVEYTAPITLALSVVQSIAMPYMPTMAMAGVLKELWTGELISKFRHEGSFMQRIPSANQYVNNDVIHLADIGADPEVLINNTTYPIGSVSRTDDDVTISLDKYDTTNTAIKDDELYALPYDKEGSVIRQHRETLEESTIEKSLHALCPSTNSDDSPVIATTGDSNGETNARKRMIPADIISMKRKFDDLKIPKRDRILVLCNQHVEDLLLVSENFEKNYINKDIATGKIMQMYGFEIHECAYNPVMQSGTKQSFDAESSDSLDQNVSVAFYAGRAVKATGSVKMYYSAAETDPENRQTLIGFNMRHIAFPKTTKGFGAIYSAIPA